MSMFGAFKELYHFFKFLKPKTFTYGCFPQTVKPLSVQLTKEGELFRGDDGNLYAEKKISCKKKVTFSDGQKFSDGDCAYFRIEPVLFEIADNIVVVQTVGKGRREKKKNVKSDRVLCLAKYVLAESGQTLELFSSSIKDDTSFSAKNTGIVEMVSVFRGAFSLHSSFWDAFKVKTKKKVTDYALACGVTVKGKKAYHTAMGNHLCVAPSGKIVDHPKKAVFGEVLYLDVPQKEVLALRESQRQK